MQLFLMQRDFTEMNLNLKYYENKINWVVKNEEKT
jgi:hypothetical protein